MTPEEIRAEIDHHSRVLTADRLIKIAKEQGWQKRNSNSGGHCVLERKGYSHISIPYHGKSSECDRTTTRMYLEQIYQPALDAAQEQAAKRQELLSFITRLEQMLYESEQRFHAEFYLKLIEVERRIGDYETHKLKECDRTIEQLLTEKQKQYFEQLQEDLQRILQNNKSLNQQMRLYQQEIEAKDNQLRAIQQTVAEMREKILELAQTVAEERENGVLRYQELEAAREAIAMHQRARRWQKKIAIVALAFLSLLIGIAFSSGIVSFNR